MRTPAATVALQERFSGVRIVAQSLFTYTRPSRNMIEVTSLLRLDRASNLKLAGELALFCGCLTRREPNILGIGMTKMSTSVDKLMQMAR